jgi:hypothetical protein
MAVAPFYPNDRAAIGGDALAPPEQKEQSKIDWWQLAMFLLALLCFAGAAILWMHSGQAH